MVIKQAETFRRVLKITEKRSGAVIDLTGCTAYSQMRKKPGGDLIATADCTIEAAKGEITVLWDAEQTADFPLGKAGYDVWLVVSDQQKCIMTEEVDIVKPYTENLPIPEEEIS